ncbi:hypothetical protein ACJX0J_039620, partial [Zea mays]
MQKFISFEFTQTIAILLLFIFVILDINLYGSCLFLLFEKYKDIIHSDSTLFWRKNLLAGLFRGISSS